MSVVLVSSSRIVGYVGCRRKSFLMSGSAAATPGATCTASTQSEYFTKVTEARNSYSNAANNPLWPTHSCLGNFLLCIDWFAGPEKESRLASRGGNCRSLHNETRTHKLCGPQGVPLCPIDNLRLPDREESNNRTIGAKNTETRRNRRGQGLMSNSILPLKKACFTSMTPFAEC